MADDFEPIYTPGSGAPAYDGDPQGPRNSPPPSSTPPADAGGADVGSDGSTTPPTGADTGGPGGDSGLIRADNDSDSGLGINVVDTDGNGDGLINVESAATSGVDAVDGLTVDAVHPDHLIDAHAPGLADATVDNPGLLDDALDGIGGGDLLGGLTGGDGLTVEALGDNLVEVNGDPLLGDGLGDGIGDVVGAGGLAGGLTGDGIAVEALNGDNIAEAHVPGVADATVGGAELGQILGSTGFDGVDLGGIGGDGITVDALNVDSVADAHVPGAADVTVGSDLGGGSLLDLGNLV